MDVVFNADGSLVGKGHFTTHKDCTPACSDAVTLVSFTGYVGTTNFNVGNNPEISFLLPPSHDLAGMTLEQDNAVLSFGTHGNFTFYRHPMGNGNGFGLYRNSLIEGSYSVSPLDVTIPSVPIPSIPEPSSVILMATMLAGVGYLCRKNFAVAREP